MEYRILGPLELWSAERSVALGGERQQKLLALLLLNAGAVVTFDRLIDELWEDPPQTARRQVCNAAAAVRRVVTGGGGRLATSTHGYRLDLPDGSLDADRFRSAVRDAEVLAGRGEAARAVELLHGALDLWRGPVLAGLGSASIDAAGHVLAEQRLQAVERLAELRLELGEVTSLLGPLAGQVAEHPLRESLRATLVRALDRAGRRGDALAVFEEGRRALADQLGADPGPELRELHAELLRAQPAAPRRSPLPFDIPDFTGRESEVDSLVEAIGTRSPAIVTIEGMGGIGKTALAVHVAHRLEDRFPDGRCYVDLRGFTAGTPPMTAGAALEVLLRQLGVPAEEVPVDPDARRELWLTEVSHRRVLVVLDNAADAHQVRALLPGAPGAVVIVVSRCHLMSIEGAVPVSLDVLPGDDAVALFRRIAGPRADAEPEAVAEVISLCGRLPLAIRIAASRFSRRPWTVAHLADRLRDRQRRSRAFTANDLSVAGVLALSYHHLGTDRQELFRLLSLVPGADFDAHAAAALAGVPVFDAQDVLEELVECNLLMQRRADRYCLHDLVRDCARDLAGAAHAPSELDTARHRLFDYYLHLADVRGRRSMPGRRGFEPELRWPAELPASESEDDDIRQLRAEYKNMVAVAGYASTHGWHVHAWQLPCLLMPYLTRVGQRSGVLELSRNALKAARALGDRRGESMALTTIAFALREAGRHGEVLEFLDRAIAISRELGDLPAAVGGLRDLGASQVQAGMLEAAAASFAEAVALARSTGDQRAEVNSAIDLGLVDCNLGRHAEAEARFRDALAVHQLDGYVGGEVVVLINIGWLAQLRGRDAEAVVALERAVRLSREIGMSRGEGISLAWLGVTYRRLGRTEDAVRVGREALESARRMDLREPEGDALNGLAETYLAAGRLREAETMLWQAEELAMAGALPMVRARAHEGLAHVAHRRGDHDWARTHWERALELYPAGAVDAENPRAHLDDAAALCMRCVRGQGSPRALTVVRDIASAV
ncbi:DNA-binding transcriptional activator of the SARP family [Lentzea xinjiangensis]|uniref:DNA-binding transcriptional activator of the SARP family n=1 Tax=Lentzea xinjiangensis TaxID=402600 RepID=A0A1H9IZM6_9PSEU|nr:BTAD domain-containing putative transcriptional regulator [Lentzea xinjiangensis]SEQ79979.1 DNA-binding transcriptional activator of the SARP family [Lentzea xinjiangensis]